MKSPTEQIPERIPQHYQGVSLWKGQLLGHSASGAGPWVPGTGHIARVTCTRRSSRGCSEVAAPHSPTGALLCQGVAEGLALRGWALVSKSSPWWLWVLRMQFPFKTTYAVPRMHVSRVRKLKLTSLQREWCRDEGQDGGQNNAPHACFPR